MRSRWPAQSDAPTFIHTDKPTGRDPTIVFGRQAPKQANNTTIHPFAPFLNATVFHLMEWFYQLAEKTLEDLNYLVCKVILADDFDREDLLRFDAGRKA